MCLFFCLIQTVHLIIQFTKFNLNIKKDIKEYFNRCILLYKINI
jgi:hypothetical protein